MHSQSESKILPLAPRNDLNDKRFDVYKKYLTQVFDNPRIHNIALGSSLGSGKSSILRSFDRQRSMDRERFLYVSLIDFSEIKHTEKEDQNTLEYSIMSQLMSRCSQRDLPECSICKIPEPFQWLKLCALCLAAICFAVFVLVFDERFALLAERLGFDQLHQMVNMGTANQTLFPFVDRIIEFKQHLEPQELEKDFRDLSKEDLYKIKEIIDQLNEKQQKLIATEVEYKYNSDTEYSINDNSQRIRKF